MKSEIKYETLTEYTARTLPNKLTSIVPDTDDIIIYFQRDNIRDVSFSAEQERSDTRTSVEFRSAFDFEHLSFYIKASFFLAHLHSFQSI